MQQLDIPTVRELEDFIITECFYSNILQGKLDQRQRCLQVHSTSSRDIKLQQLPELSSALAGWYVVLQSAAGVMQMNAGHYDRAYAVGICMHGKLECMAKWSAWHWWCWL